MTFEKLPIALQELNGIFVDLIKEAIIKNKKTINDCSYFEPNATDLINAPTKLSVKIEKNKAAIVNVLFDFKSQYGEFLKFP